MLKFMSKLACLGRLFVVTCFLLGGVVGGVVAVKIPHRRLPTKDKGYMKCLNM